MGKDIRDCSQGGIELWVGDVDTLRMIQGGGAVSHERGDGKGHGYPVVEISFNGSAK